MQPDWEGEDESTERNKAMSSWPFLLDIPLPPDLLVETKTHTSVLRRVGTPAVDFRFSLLSSLFLSGDIARVTRS